MVKKENNGKSHTTPSFRPAADQGQGGHRQGNHHFFDYGGLVTLH